jgi:hypothetical protein
LTKPKIAIAGFIRETNTFSPYVTPASEFEKADGWPKATRGDEIVSTFRDLNIGIGGFITEGTDFELVPFLWCSAEPASDVTTEAFEVYCGASSITCQPFLSGLHEVLRSLKINALGDPFLAIQLCYAVLAAQAVQNDPYLLL